MNILINDALSRSYFGHQPYEPEIIMILDELELSMDDFRTSQRLQKLFQEIVTVLLNEKTIFPSSGSHFLTIRLGTMTSLLVHELCTPRLYDLLEVGAKLKNAFAGLWSSTISAHELQHEQEKDEHYAKKMENRFMVRVKGIILEAFSLMKLNENALVSTGGDFKNIDERLSYLLLNLMDFRTSAILPNVMTLRQYGYEALENMTCYLLSVTATSSVLKQSIHGVINHMSDELAEEQRHDATFAGNVPALTRYLMDYFQYLRNHAAALIKDCRKDEIVNAVNPNLRHALKNENYESPTDAIAIYHQRYRKQLTHLSIPLQAYSMQDIRQAKKDLMRDRVSVNKVLYCSDRPRSVCDAVKDEIKKVLVFSLGVDRPELFEESISSAEKTRNGETSSHASFCTAKEDSPASSLEQAPRIAETAKAPSPSVKKPPAPLVLSPPLEERSLISGKEEEGSPLGLMRRSSMGAPFNEETEAFLRKRSNNSSLTTCFSSPNVSLRNASIATVAVDAEPQNFTPHSIFHYLPEQLQSNEYFYADILIILHAYTTLAASRTFAGGDAFIILNDLYGGDGLTLCPYKQEHGAGLSPAPSPARGMHKTASRCFVDLQRVDSSRRNEEANDVQIAITSSGIKVVVKERYKLFSSHDLQSCCDPSALVPLMCFECTTTTILVLCSERIARIPLDLQNISSSSGFQEHEKAYRLFQLLITNPQQICQRAVSIEPFMQ